MFKGHYSILSKEKIADLQHALLTVQFRTAPNLLCCLNERDLSLRLRYSELNALITAYWDIFNALRYALIGLTKRPI